MKNSQLRFSEYMQNISRSISFGKFILMCYARAWCGTGEKKLRSTNPETPIDQLCIGNCFELPLDSLSQLNSTANQRAAQNNYSQVWNKRSCSFI